MTLIDKVIYVTLTQIRQKQQISSKTRQDEISHLLTKTKMRTTAPSFVVILLTLLSATICGQDTDVSPNEFLCASMRCSTTRFARRFH